MTYDGTKKKAEIKVLKELTEDILLSGKSLLVEMTAIDTNKNEARAVVEIILPKLTGPEFKDLYYEVDYPSNGKEPIEVGFQFKDNTDPKKIKIDMEGKVKHEQLTFWCKRRLIQVK